MGELGDEQVAKVSWCYVCWCNSNIVSISSRHLYPSKLEGLEDIDFDKSCSCPATIIVSGYYGDEDELKGPFKHMPTFPGVSHAKRKPYKKEIKEAYSNFLRDRSLDRAVSAGSISFDIFDGATPSTRVAAPSEDFTAQSESIMISSGYYQDPFNAPDRKTLLQAQKEALKQPRKSRAMVANKSLKPLPVKTACTPLRIPRSPAAKRATRSVPSSSSQTIRSPENKDFPFSSLSPRSVFSEMISAMRRQSGERYKAILENNETELFESLRAYVLPRAWEVFRSEDYSLSK